MARSVAPFSEHGLPFEAGVDIASLTTNAAYRITSRRVVLGSTEAAVANFVINTTKKHSLGPVGFAGTLALAFVSSAVVPAGGTLTWKVVAYSASGDAEVVLTDAADAETITARESQSLVLAATNVAVAAADTLELHCIASNATVTTDAAQVWVTMVFTPTPSATHTR